MKSIPSWPDISDCEHDFTWHKLALNFYCVILQIWWPLPIIEVHMQLVWARESCGEATGQGLQQHNAGATASDWAEQVKLEQIVLKL